MELTSQNPGYFLPQQFANPANPQVHREATAREILAQMPDGIAAVVAGVGTPGYGRQSKRGSIAGGYYGTPTWVRPRGLMEN